VGLKLAFDKRTLTNHSASRFTRYVYIIATFTAKAKAFVASLKPQLAFAPIAA
jgi:hypothetical protein